MNGRARGGLVDQRLEEAESEVGRGRSLGERTGYEFAGQWHEMQLCTLRRQQGRLAELAELHGEARLLLSALRGIPS